MSCHTFTVKYAAVYFLFKNVIVMGVSVLKMIHVLVSLEMYDKAYNNSSGKKWKMVVS